MGIRVISVEPKTKGNFTQRTVLDGREYLLTFRWNQREERWYFSIADSAEEPIVSGVKICVNFPLLTNRIVDERRPPGEIFPVDASGLLGDFLGEGAGSPPADPALADLGVRVVLLYIEQLDGEEIDTSFTGERSGSGSSGGD